MMIDLCNKLVDNDLTRDELLERVVVKKTERGDFEEICKTLARSFNLSSEGEAMMQLIRSNALLNESVKLVDKENGDIYGLLIFCHCPIQLGSPIIGKEPHLSSYLNEFTQINGHSFIIDERLRGTSLDKEMLNFNLPFLSDNFDFIWIGVEKDLRTHGYWKRLGFVEVFSIDEATFYLVPLSKKMIEMYL